MAEYIERNAAVQDMKEFLDVPGISEGISLGVQLRILAIPAEEVAPVRHGRWEMYFADKYLMCSACKASFWDENGDGGPNYCPNCGAKMDEGEAAKDEQKS